MVWILEAATLAQMGGNSSLVRTLQMWWRCALMMDNTPFPESAAEVWAYTTAFVMSSTPNIVAVIEVTTAAWMMTARLGCPPPPPPRRLLHLPRLLRHLLLRQGRLPLSFRLLLHHRLNLPQPFWGWWNLWSTGAPAFPSLDGLRLWGRLQH